MKRNDEKRYIEAENLKLAIRRFMIPSADFDGTVQVEDAERFYLQLVDNMPTVDVREVKRGEWRFREYGEDSYTNLTRIYECSLCGRTIERPNEADEPFCHCGADMRKE